MASPKLSAAQERELSAQLQADPEFQRILKGSYPSEPLRWAAMTQYLNNDARSPLYRVNRTTSTGDAKGTGTYRYDLKTGKLIWSTTAPQHWWEDPGKVGPVAVATAATLGAGGWLPVAGQAPTIAAPAVAAPTVDGGLLGPYVNAAGNAGGAGGAAGGAGALNWIDKALKKVGLTPRELLGIGGDVFTNIADTKASNRGNELYAQYLQQGLLNEREQEERARDVDYWNQQVGREQEGRTSGTDAWRKLLATQHTLTPGPEPSLSPYSVASRQATDTERTGAQALSDEVMKRLQGGNPLPMPTRRDPLPPPVTDMSLAKPGGLETTLGWLAPIFGGIGRVPRRNTPGPTKDPNRPWTYLDERQV